MYNFLHKKKINFLSNICFQTLLDVRTPLINSFGSNREHLDNKIVDFFHQLL